MLTYASFALGFLIEVATADNFRYLINFRRNYGRSSCLSSSCA